MLTIKILDYTAPSTGTDIDFEFDKITVIDTPVIRKIMKEIDQAVYVDCDYFIDRFGAKLPINLLSTGCKAAITVEILAMNGDNRFFDILECGVNARDTIIRNCKNGNIIMRDPGITIEFDENNDNIDVRLDDYRFTTVSRLNDYIFDEDRKNPDLGTEGIEKLQ